MIKSINHKIASASVLLSFALSSNSHSAEQSTGVARQPAPPGRYRPATPRTIDPSTLTGKLIFGYQGWFSTADDDGPLDNWNHWSADRKRPMNQHPRADVARPFGIRSRRALRHGFEISGRLGRQSVFGVESQDRDAPFPLDAELQSGWRDALSLHQPGFQPPGLPRLLQQGSRQHPPVSRGVWPRVRRSIRHLGLPRTVRREGHRERLEGAGG